MGNSNNKEKKSSLELSPEATTTSDLRYDSEINQWAICKTDLGMVEKERGRMIENPSH